MTLCYRCKKRPIPPSYLKHQHYRCYTCHSEQYAATKAKADRKYHAKTKDAHARRQREYRKRRVRIAGREINFPTIEMKQQAAALIARGRDVLKQRQQGRA